MSTVGHTVTIAGETFTIRRETFRVLLGKAADQDAMDALVDEANGIAVELQHAEGDLLALGNTEGPFPAERRTELLEQLRGLRAKATEAGNAIFTARIGALAKRLEPSPDVDWLIDNLDPLELERVTEAVNRRPPDLEASAGSSASTSSASAA